MNELSNSSFGVFVSPLEGESRFIVMANVAHDFAMEVGLGFEDATCNKIPLDFGEPDLDLIEPRGVGGGVMELDVGVGAQEALDRFSLMSREVVGNNMNLSVGGLSGDHLAQELYKLSTGMAVGCLAQDFAGGRVQGRIERKSAVAKVFESVTFGPSGRERQDGIQTIKGLNGALFIDTENSRMGRRLQVETDDSGRLLLKLWVIADHVVATPVRLQPRLSPHPRSDSAIVPHGSAWGSGMPSRKQATGSRHPARTWPRDSRSAWSSRRSAKLELSWALANALIIPALLGFHTLVQCNR